MSAKKILFLTPQLPYPPHQGTTIRNYNVIKELASRYRIHLMSFSMVSDQPDSQEKLRPLCESITTIPAPARAMCERALATLFSPWPDMALRLESPAFHQHLDALLKRQRFDIIQVEGIEMGPYLLQIAARADPRPILIFDDHNAEYVLQQRAFETDIRKPRRWPAAFYSLVQWRKLRAYERFVCRRADWVIAVSETDAQALRRLDPGLRVQVVPNGVDLAYYQSEGFTSPLPKSPSLVFTGKMDFRPNVDAVLWFYHEVWPRIQESWASPLHFYIVGKSPHPRLQPLASDERVTLTGHVPDVRPYIGGADVYVVPLRIGGGTRLKVLEAMAMGKAIVSTTLGCEGIGLQAGRDALLADTPQAFAEQVLTLLRNPGLRQKLGQQARRFVETRYDWQRIVPLLEQVYAQLP